MAFLQRFCQGDADGLAPPRDPALGFRGPLHRFSSAAQYLQSLRTDPPGRRAYRVLSVTEDAGTVAVFWACDGPGEVLLRARLFQVRNGRIAAIVRLSGGGATGRRPPVGGDPEPIRGLAPGEAFDIVGFLRRRDAIM